jgi:hypothetical protein
MHIMLNKLGRLLLVQDNEISHVRYFFILFTLIGSGMALGRGTTDALFFKRYGIEFLPMMYIILSFLLSIVSIVYAAYSDRIPSERFFYILFVTFIILLVGAWGLMAFPLTDAVYPAYFLIYEIASELLLVHAALYLSHNFLSIQSKRLMPLIFAGTQIGVIIGGLFLAYASRIVGVQNILLIWCLILASSMILIYAWHKKHGVSPYYRPGSTSSNQLQQSVRALNQGLHYMRRSDMLRAMSFALFFMVITFYVLCYSVNIIYTNTFETEETLSSFFGILTAVNSTLALLFQIFFTNRILRKFGIKTVNLFFPVTSLFSYFALFFSFTLPAALIGSFNKDAIMPAFRNPVRNLFYSALPEKIHGRAHALSIAIVLPLALMVCGILLWVMQKSGNHNYFLTIGVSAAVLYLFFNYKMNHAYVSEMLTNLKDKLFLPENGVKQALKGAPENVLGEIKKGVFHKDDQICISFSKILVDSYPEVATDIILERAKHSNNSTKDRLLNLLLPLKDMSLQSFLLDSVKTTDNHLKATAYRMLFQLKNDKAKSLLENALSDENPRIIAAGIIGVINYKNSELLSKAVERWNYLICNSEIQFNLAALDIFSYLNLLTDHSNDLLAKYKTLFIRLLNTSDEHVLQCALRTLEEWPDQDFNEIENTIYDIYNSLNTSIRLSAIKCSHILNINNRDLLLTRALEDKSSEIRSIAADKLAADTRFPIEKLSLWLIADRKGSPRAQEAILHALQKLQPPIEVIQRVATTLAQNGYIYSRALSMLRKYDGKKSAPTELMVYSLDERIREYIDLALMALEDLENPENIKIVRAGVKSTDPRHISRACEALRNMKTKNVIEMIGNVLENLTFQKEKKNGYQLQPFYNLPSLLLWCLRQNDPWINTCAEQALLKENI